MYRGQFWDKSLRRSVEFQAVMVNKIQSSHFTLLTNVTETKEWGDDDDDEDEWQLEPITVILLQCCKSE